MLVPQTWFYFRPVPQREAWVKCCFSSRLQDRIWVHSESEGCDNEIRWGKLICTSFALTKLRPFSPPLLVAKRGATATTTAARTSAATRESGDASRQDARSRTNRQEKRNYFIILQCSSCFRTAADCLATSVASTWVSMPFLFATACT